MRLALFDERQSLNQLKNILVAVDFSDCSKAALAQAVRIAGWNGAALHALHVIEPLADPSLAPVMAQATDVDAEVDKMMLNCEILNGALELLPQALAAMRAAAARRVSCFIP